MVIDNNVRKMVYIVFSLILLTVSVNSSFRYKPPSTYICQTLIIDVTYIHHMRKWACM